MERIKRNIPRVWAIVFIVGFIIANVLSIKPNLEKKCFEQRKVNACRDLIIQQKEEFATLETLMDSIKTKADKARSVVVEELENAMDVGLFLAWQPQ